MTRYLYSLLLFGACANDLHHGVDAPPADTANDTVGPEGGDPPANAVKLTVTRGAFPAPGIAVVFQNADSSLVAAKLTNDRGLAWAEMASGGFVTAIDHQGAGLDELTTFSAVQQADALELAFNPAGDTGAWPVVLSISSDFAGASAYQVFTSCGGPFGADPTSPAETLLVGCKGVADIAVVSYDDIDQPQRAYFLSGVAVPDPPPPLPDDAMPPIYPPLAATGTFGTLMTKTFAYVNVPSFVSFIGTYHAFSSVRGRVFERTAGASRTGSTASTQIAIPSANAPSLVASNLYTQELGAQTIYESRSSAMAPYSLDVGASLLPPLTTPPTFDAASRTISWTERSGPLAPDLVRARLHVYRDDIPTGNAWGWRIIAPRNATSVTYPTLPVYGFDFNPKPGDVTGVDELTTADVPGGYAAARHNGFGDLTPLIVGTADRMVVQMLNSFEL